jgi:ABC-type lipoprotein release transport system permease subunit
LALNAAVLFDDPSRGDDTITALRAKIAEEGLALDVVDWQRAAGLVGQIITVLEVILVVAIGIIFLVALVILNNTMVMTTLDRTTEIGTLRAIGAPKAFVISMFMVETLVLALIAGALGAAVGVGFVLWLGHVGVPAVADIMVLLFAGKRLYPEVGVDNALMGAGVVVVVAVLSTLYPAFLASRVPPVVAMQGKD